MNYRFKQVRKALGLTQAEIAEKLNKTSRMVQYYESGESNIELDIILELQKLYNVSSDWLIAGIGEMFNSEQKNIDIDDLYKDLNLRQTFIMNAVRQMGDEELTTLLKYIEERQIIKDYEAKTNKEKAG